MKMKQEYTMSKMLKEQHNIGNDNMKDDNRTSKALIEQENIVDDNMNNSKMKTSSFRFTTIGKYRKRPFFRNEMPSIQK